MTATGEAKRLPGRARNRRAAAALAGALALSACAEAQLGVALAKRANATMSVDQAPSAAHPATAGPGAAPARAAQPPRDTRAAYDDHALNGDADVPAMIRDAALFSAEAQTLWDGLPSIGGAWVAHPGVGRNLTVEAVNLDTGRSKRLPALRLTQRPGRPVIQLSAEAALALGMAPGRLTMVRLTGLRLRPAPPKAPPGAQARSPGAVETFGIAAAPPATTPDPALTAARTPAPAVRPDLKQSAPPAPTPTAPTMDIAALSPAAAPPPARRPAAAAPATAGPYVQIGAFGDRANAAAAAALFRARGLRVSELPAGRLSRVLLGPFDDLSGARAARDAAAGAGFSDAYVYVTAQ